MFKSLHIFNTSSHPVMRPALAHMTNSAFSLLFVALGYPIIAPMVTTPTCNTVRSPECTVSSSCNNKRK